jgi:phage terminase large subunit-like protein
VPCASFPGKEGRLLIDEKWYYLIEEIEEKFGVEEKNVEEIPERRTKIETVVFTGAGGKMKLERTSKAVVLDKQMKYSRRIGGETQEKYVYSDTEKTYRVQLYEWDEAAGGWREIDFRKLRTG